jgi:hypothetical protein
MSVLALCGIAGVVVGVYLGGTRNRLRWFRQGFTSIPLQHHGDQNIGDQRMDRVEITRCIGKVYGECRAEIECAE